MRGLRSLLLVLLAGATLGPVARAADPFDRKAIEALAATWARARPTSKFGAWDPKVRADLLARARALGRLPEGALEPAADVFWKALRKEWKPLVKDDGRLSTPYGPATWIQNGRGGPKAGLVVGLHGGGEGVGNASEAAGKWVLPGCLHVYPQGLRLVHDTWNTVHGERFVLTLIERAKVLHEVDPDRVYAMGFSMGGTGSWFLAGRYPDLLAAAAPCAGVLMAAPRSQVATKEEVQALQHGFVPNVRNLPMYWFTGLDDRNCMPGTYLFAWDLLQELRARDPGGYANLHFRTYPGVAHAFPPGEPSGVLKWIATQRRDPLPEKVVWEQADNPFPLPEDEVDRQVGRIEKADFYWVHCDRPGEKGIVTAVRRGNEFEVAFDGGDVADLTLWLRPGMIDPAKEVIVRCGGKELYRGTPVPDVATVLETLDSRVDRGLAFDRRIRLGSP